ncbi:uncharacterized protein [Argopecten irradians]|uniref:uncharacterized protein n=1 Tax=Argopecten irradians TaxID=31199 RepID=UPI003720EC05
MAEVWKRAQATVQYWDPASSHDGRIVVIVYIFCSKSTALINTMYMNNTLHFSLRLREEYANIRWGDVELKFHSTGEKYLEFTERATKTRNGINGGSRPEQRSLICCPTDVGSIVKSICESAGIKGRKVNPSARKTAVTTLVHAGVPPTLVQQHSGHKNISSVHNYCYIYTDVKLAQAQELAIFQQKSTKI